MKRVLSFMFIVEIVINRVHSLDTSPVNVWPGMNCQNYTDTKAEPYIKWNINIDNLNTTMIFSEAICIKNIQWRLSAEISKGDSHKCLGVYMFEKLETHSFNIASKAIVKIVLSSKTDHMFISHQTEELIFNASNYGWGFKCHIEMKDLVNPANGYLNNGSFTLEGHLLAVETFVDRSTTKYLSGSKDFRYDYTYDSEIDGWLKLHRIPATWRKARLTCDLEGAILASPINRTMLTAMKNLLIQETGIHDCGVFTGVHATFSKGHFYSLEGIPISKMPVEWEKGEPNNEDCLILTYNGTAADVDCTENFPYICYKNYNKSMRVIECGTTDEEYIYNIETESCYKFHRYARTWPKAFEVCANEGSHLAIINSETEARELSKIFKKNLKNIVWKKTKHDVIFLGFYEWSDRNIYGYYTIEGTPLEEAGYSTWAPGQPNNTDDVSYGAMFENGKLDDVESDLETAFICEMKPGELQHP